MEKLNRDARRYLREIRGCVPCAGRMRRKMMRDIHEMLWEFFSKQPEADYSTIVDRFGTPQQIASSYVDEMATGEVLSNLYIRKKVLTLVSTLAIVIVLLWLGVVSYECAHNENVSSGYFEVTVAEVESTQMEGDK